MPSIITSIYNPVALAATCRQCQWPVPQEGSVQLAEREAFGWVVQLPGVLHPIVCDTLTGLVAYHLSDNGFVRYARIMQFIHRCHDVQARLRRQGPTTRPPVVSRLRPEHHLVACNG